MALGKELDPAALAAEAAQLTGKGKGKKSEVDKALDSFGRDILNTEAKWRMASLETLKGLKRFISAVDKAAETLEKVRGLRALQGQEKLGLDPTVQRRYASLRSRQSMAQGAIESNRASIEADRQQAKEERAFARRQEQLAIKELRSRKGRIAYGPDSGGSFVMQRRGRAIPVLGDYTSSRVSPIRSPGTEMVPMGARDIELYKHPGGLYAPQNYGAGGYGALATGGIPTRGYMRGGGPTNLPGPYRGATMPGGFGGGGGWGMLGYGGVAGTAWDAAKWAYDYTKKSVDNALPDLEEIYKASRTTGGSYGGYLGGIGGGVSRYRLDSGYEAMGYTARSAAAIQNIYASPFRSTSALGLAGALARDVGGTGTGNISKEEWAGLLNKELSMGMLGGTKGLEQFQKSISAGFMDAGKHLLPPPEAIENIEKYLQVMSGSTAIRSPGEIHAMATGAAGYGLPSFRNFGAQAQALSAYDQQMQNLPGNQLRFMEYVNAATGFTGGRSPLMSPDQLAGFASKYGGLSKGFKFNKAQREAIETARRMGGMPGVLMQEHVLEMAGVKPEMISNIGMDMFRKAGVPRSEREFWETLTGGGGFYPERRWATGGPGTISGGTLPPGGTAYGEVAASKRFLTGPDGKPIEDLLRLDAPDLFKAAKENAADYGLSMGKATDAISLLAPAVTSIDTALTRLTSAIHFASDNIESYFHHGSGPTSSSRFPRSGPISAAPEAPPVRWPMWHGGKPGSSSTGITPATPSS